MHESVNRGPRRPTPQHKPNTMPYNNGVIKYDLNPAEMEFLQEGRLDLIPAASQRGLVAPPVQPRQFKEPKVEIRKPRASPEVAKAISAKMLQSDLAAGKTNYEIAEQYGISHSTVSKLLKQFGIGNPKGVQRQHRKGMKA